MSETWYYADHAGHVGPLTRQQLMQTLETVANPADALVWCDRFQDWRSARDVPELWAEPAARSRSGMVHSVAGMISKRELPRSWLLFLGLPLLGTANNSIGRGEMGRLSRDRRISKVVQAWFSDGGREILVRADQVLRANSLFVLVAVGCMAYGIYDGLLLGSLLSGIIVGVLSAAIANVAILTIRKYRVKKPTSLLIWIGNIAYWLGWTLASYGIFLIVYRLSHFGLGRGLEAAGALVPSLIFYPTIGWCIRYMLGATIEVSKVNPKSSERQAYFDYEENSEPPEVRRRRG